MKKSKTLVSLLAILLIGASPILSACGESSAETVYPEATVSLRTSSEIEVEVGGTARIAGTVTTEEDDATLTISVDDPTIISLPTRTPGAASYTITGLQEGTCTVTLAATVNPDAFVTIQVTVIAARPALATLIDTVSYYDNYTIETEGNLGGSEYAIKAECADNMFIVGYDEGLTGEYVAYYGNDDYDLWGIFAAQDDYVSYIYTDVNTGSLATSALERVKGNDGYLTSDTFAGNHYRSYSSKNDYFNGLQALNSDFYTSEKASDNIYEIDGSADDLTSALAECMLLEVFDPVLNYLAIYSSVDSDGYYYYYDVAETVDTTVTVTDVDQIEITFEVGDYYSTSTITNVGTTEIDLGPSGLVSELQAVEALPTPELDSRLQVVADAIAGNDYVVDGSYYFTVNNAQLTFDCQHYYTEDYCAFYVLNQNNYEKLYNGFTLAYVQSEGYSTKEAFLNDFSYVYYVDEYNRLAAADINYSYDSDGNFTVTADFDGATHYSNSASDLYSYFGYLSSTGLFTVEALGQLSDYETFFSSMGSGFWTTGENLTRAYGEAIGIIDQVDSYYPNRVGSDVFGIIPTFNDDYTSVTGFTLYYGFDETGSGSYSVYSWPYYDVGTAAESCPFDEQYHIDVVGDVVEEEDPATSSSGEGDSSSAEGEDSSSSEGEGDSSSSEGEGDSSSSEEDGNSSDGSNEGDGSSSDAGDGAEKADFIDLVKIA